MRVNRPWKIAVLGSSSASEDSEAAEKAYLVGRIVAQRGAVLLTGGCPGLPHCAVRGALDAGGITVAVSPAMSLRDHSSGSHYGYPGDSTITILTGMGTKGRNVILVRSADACIFVGGGMGTLNEFTIAFADLPAQAAIGVLSETGGLSGHYVSLARAAGSAPAALLAENSDPRILLADVFAHLQRRIG